MLGRAWWGLVGHGGAGSGVVRQGLFWGLSLTTRYGEVRFGVAGYGKAGHVPVRQGEARG